MMEKRGPAHGATKQVADSRTLFVRFHPPAAVVTRQHLAEHFSQYGPVNRCSVIRQAKPKVVAVGEGGDGDDDYDRGSKGYGFVRFVHEDDAAGAAAARGGSAVMVVDGVAYRLRAERAVDAAGPRSQTETGGGRKDRATTWKAAAKGDTAEAIATTANLSKVGADKAYQAEAKRKRTSRVIVRNLSFYASEQHVRAAMERYFGPVAVIDLPLVPSPSDDAGAGRLPQGKRAAAPRHRGFAFVTFTNAGTARRAVEGGIDVEIKKRAVAIDYSVSKAEHQRLMREGQREKPGGNEEDTESEAEGSDDDGDGSKDEAKKEGEDGSSDSDGSDEDGSDDGSDYEDDSGSSDDDDSKSEGKSKAEDGKEARKTQYDSKDSAKETPVFDETEAVRTLFLRNLPFDATRHDLFELFRIFGRIESVYLVKDRQTGAFRGTAFVRFANEKECGAALEASSNGGVQASELFVSSKNMAMGMTGPASGECGDGLSLKGRRILVDRAVDRTTASSLAVQRDPDGRPIRKAVGKDRRNLYLKNEGRVAAKADGELAKEAGAAHGGVWEDLPAGDRARRERAFADKATKLRSPLFFINPHRISVRNLSKHVDETGLKRLAFEALRAGLSAKLATPQDAVAHWRAGGELSHAEVAHRAADPALAVPPLDEKNVRGAIPSVYIDRDVAGGKKTAYAPSRGFGFVEFTHHAHALACLRQLNNNPAFSKEYAAGGHHAAEMARRGRGKKKGGGKGGGVEPDPGAEFLSENGRVCLPRLIVEFTAENKVKAKQQAEKIAQKKANKTKQWIEKKEKEKEEKQRNKPVEKGKEKKKGRGALQREKKRARKETGEDGADARTTTKQEYSLAKKQRPDETRNSDTFSDVGQKKSRKGTKPQKNRKVDKDEAALEEMIRSYKTSFVKGAAVGGRDVADERDESKPKKAPQEKVATKRWFE